MLRSWTKIAVDIGGTFTDIVAMRSAGSLHRWKVPTSMHDPSQAVVIGIERVIRELGIDAGNITEVLHGTTVGSNAILQKTGAVTGLITTKGFRDILEIGRVRVPEMFDLMWDKPEPLVPRRLRLEVAERIDSAGRVVVPIELSQVREAAETFLDAGVAAVAISFLNSFHNPDHELAAEALLRREFPSLEVTTSVSVLPEIKEYERTSTTVVNAYLLRQMTRYVGTLRHGLFDLGIQAPLFIMTSNGGMITAEYASRRPVYTVASGPAGGVIGGASLSLARGDGDVVVFDMGGTTAKAVLVESGEPQMTSEYEFREGISISSRFMKAGGYMLKVPAIDIAEVGAGGGSIAYIDDGGLFRVGPRSAGSEPGPACYGRGGKLPTVTDANVALGLLNQESLAGGELTVFPERSQSSIREHIAERLGITVEAAALGIRQVANTAMARAIRAITVERGLDPRSMTLLAMGGNGGGHAFEVARELGIGRIIIPPFSGVFAALGMLTGNISHNLSQMVLKPLGKLTDSDLLHLKGKLEEEAVDRLRHDGFDRKNMVFTWTFDLRYEGQASELSVPVKSDRIEELGMTFASMYTSIYGYVEDSAIEAIKLGLKAEGMRIPKLDLADCAHAITREPEIARYSRNVLFAGEPSQWQSVPVCRRADISGTAGRGPLIIEEFDSTIIVPPNAEVTSDEFDCIVINLR